MYLVPTVYMRWRCQLYHPERVLVVPQASMHIVKLPKMRRHIFLYLKSNCEQPHFYSVGKFMRSHLTKTLAKQAVNTTDILAQCLDTVIGSPT